MCDDPSNDLTSIRRTALVVHHLERGESLSVRNVVRLTGLTPSGARHLLRAISYVLPVYYDAAAHTWQVLEYTELL